MIICQSIERQQSISELKASEVWLTFVGRTTQEVRINHTDIYFLSTHVGVYTGYTVIKEHLFQTFSDKSSFIFALNFKVDSIYLYEVSAE